MVECTRSRIFRTATVLALALVIAGCTKGGQFDPTEIFNSDVFDSKKKLKGERSPVFPEGVPGATSGVPADLVKGYQAPEQSDADVAVPGPTPPATAETEKPKPKPKPKPKLVAQKPPAAPAASAPAASPTRITVGPTQKQATQPGGSQSVWPAAPASPQSQSSQSVWPAPPQTTSSQPAQSSQSIWPDPPAAGTSR
jgi:outer membrane biosynthesis protein TonB